MFIDYLTKNFYTMMNNIWIVLIVPVIVNSESHFIKILAYKNDYYFYRIIDFPQEKLVRLVQFD